MVVIGIERRSKESILRMFIEEAYSCPKMVRIKGSAAKKINKNKIIDTKETTFVVFSKKVFIFPLLSLLKIGRRAPEKVMREIAALIKLNAPW